MTSPIGSPILRPLLHRWRLNLAVLAGAATTAAVLCGALVVGDSVRASLRALTLERLGGIDHALVGQRFFRDDVAERVSSPAPAPAILLRANARHARSGARASQVGLAGVDERFFTVFGDGGIEAAAALATAEGRPGAAPVVLSDGLARALEAAVGDTILISLKRWTEVPRGSLLGRKDTASVVETLRLSVSAVLADRGAGRFGLGAHQSAPLNAFMPLPALQRALGQPGTVNAVLTPGAEPPDLDFTLEDFGLALRTLSSDDGTTYLQLESDELVLRPVVAETALDVATDLGLAAQPIISYLANRIEHDGRTAPYSTVVGLDPGPGGLPGLTPLEDTGQPGPRAGEVWVNEWLARDLDLAPGDQIAMTYFEVGPREALEEVEKTFVVAAVTAMAGLGVDTDLVQDVPGMADAEDMAEWDPPFPVDLGQVRPEDEDYWDRYRDAPKAFVSFDEGRSRWQTRWGDTTAVRLGVGADDVDSVRRAYADALVERIPRDLFGYGFQAVKAEGLAASSGATDFSGLFLGFSLFLIVSAALLAALLFRLGVEQRAGEIGLEMAIGFPLRTVRRRLLGEGALLATAGAVLGVLGAIAYAAGMLYLLRTRWLPAVGTTELHLDVRPATLVAGGLAAILVVLLAIARTVRRIGKLPATVLLKGSLDTPTGHLDGRRGRLVAVVCLGLAGLLVVFASVTGRTREAGLFFAIGPLLLVGLLAAFGRLGAGRDGAGLPRRGGLGALLRMAAANGARHRGRSLLSVGLVASACFLIVTVAAFQHDYSRESLGRDSGAGGFALVGESDVPLLYDLGTQDGRAELGLPDVGDDAEMLARARIFPCRLRPGDDTSCLNLYRPREPRLVGLSPEVIDRGGFRFTRVMEGLEGSDPDNPWTMLDVTFDDGAVPVIGDANSMQYILKLPLGGSLDIIDGRGEPVALRLVAMVATSIFQSELLLAESSFVRHFPEEEGYDYFLVEAAAADASRVSQTLEAGLTPYGFDAVGTADKLAAFHAVQNTYLSTFRSLGGLGLLLGTVGLAIVLLRNALERRGELAAMRAFGFRKRTLVALVLAENALLLIGGLAIGTVAALVTVGPHLLAEGAVVPWGAIATTLGTILAVGLVACTAAAAGALRAPLLPALRAEA